MGRQGFGLLFLVAFLVKPALGFDMSQMDWGKLSETFRNENHVLKSHWKSNQEWKDWLCKGSYRYDVEFKAVVDQMKADPEHPESVLFDLTIDNVDSNLFGSYRSSKTLCIPFTGGLHVVLGNVLARVRAVAVNVGGETKIKVTILDTEFGTIHFGQGISSDVERFVARILNSAFRYVWTSKLGEWINSKVSEELNKHP